MSTTQEQLVKWKASEMPKLRLQLLNDLQAPAKSVDGTFIEIALISAYFEGQLDGYRSGANAAVSMLGRQIDVTA